MGSENRRHPRLAIALATRVQFESFEDFAEESASSLSLGGMQLTLAEAVRPGANLRLEFRLAEQHAMIRASAVVRWCQPVGARYAAGVEFVELNENARKLIEAAVARTQERRGNWRVPVALTLKVRSSGEEAFATCHAADISIGGVRMSSTRRIDVGEVLDIEFVMGGSGAAFRAEAVVKWCQPYGDQFAVGAEFRALDERTRKFVETVVRCRPHDETDLQSLIELEHDAAADVVEERLRTAKMGPGAAEQRRMAWILVAVLIVCAAAVLLALFAMRGAVVEVSSPADVPAAAPMRSPER